MLIRFSVANCLSINDRIDVSMVAMKGREVGNEAKIHDIDVLPSVALYGANASGKTNVIAALSRMCNIILSPPVSSTAKLWHKPFAFDEETKDSSSMFEAVFSIGDTIYRYGFDYEASRVYAEWLYADDGKGEKRMFYRDTDKRELIINTDIFPDGDKIKQGTVLKNWLFLQKCDQNNGDVSKQIIAFFHSIRFFGLDDFTRINIDYVSKLHDGAYRRRIEQLISSVDTGIIGLQIREKRFRLDEVEGSEADAIRGLPGADMASISLPAIFTIHKVEQSGKPRLYTLDLNYESMGTKKFFTLLYLLLDTLDKGGVAVVDELDSSMHPLLQRSLLGLFTDSELNPHHAQLIFTIHDTYVMDSKVLDASQIYLVKKDAQQVTRIDSAADYKIEANADIGKLYMQGRFGTGPHIEQFSREDIYGQE